ncbi:phage tail sheath subtilisin-like domain-containing protein [Ramlibacter sp. USB13]|uniref:Phage tail sheath subtilisin-like domain-containing protein n=1 Tax=Ramlibacter cellulosilyticus TaxID=2764187 RepID=A0A923MSK7_9BURK|nr:phage tail sheath subtilisin-like domain-containing protein [Ramlibacter cellulosilyticus]MBC5783424.1 phage tail sheath subtilisin-like domain-containing protein [Ramlibacter cellulosilyticus]
MPEYLAPGVFVEEVSFRAKSIEGVSTTTTGFIGAARSGPVHLEPDIVTSLGDFEQVYGGGDELVFSDAGRTPNFLWHAVRAFFTEGGKRLYVSRVFQAGGAAEGEPAQLYEPITAGGELSVPAPTGTGDALRYADGHARVVDLASRGVMVRARHPGAVGNWRVRFTLRGRANILGAAVDPVSRARRTTVGALAHRDLVWVRDITSPAIEGDLGRFHIALWNEDTATWSFEPVESGSPPSAPSGTPTLDELFPDPSPAAGDTLRVVTLSITLLSRDGTRELATWSDLPLDPSHRQGAGLDSVFDRFATSPASAADARLLPLVIARDGTQVGDAADVLSVLFDGDALPLLQPSETERLRNVSVEDKLTMGVSADFLLEGGHDGERPAAGDYEGAADPRRSYSLGLRQFEDIEDISIVAAPGYTWDYANYDEDADAIQGLLIAHAERMRYRIAVLDSAEGQTIAEVRDMRARIDSKYAALYYPWVTVLDPVTRNEIDLPPSGFVAGIYARNDVDRGVYKAPANEVVRLALGFETLLNKGQQEVLNPEGINCFRFFEGRGMRLWGARTISSDPEWKYVNVRRYFAYLERSIDKGTQWAVFEPNGEQLWANVRRTVEDFLLNEWQSGALLGDKPEKAFFVRCDRSTMTQNDLDNGRLICLIGVAPLKPAEFVIFRIGQWTADRKV